MKREYGQVTEYQKTCFDLGLKHTEMNTILGRIRRRPSGEPTAKERARLAQLREEIAELKKGQGP